ncbi:MAG: methyltransferase [Pseudomonadota bacterium]
MNGDSALGLLLNLIRTQSRPALWVLDEHGAGEMTAAANPTVTVITNRFDVAEQLRSRGWNAQFSDYDFPGIRASSIETLFFRIAKEKPVVHHVFNAAANLLTPNGQLIIAGTKQQGIKTYAKTAAARLGGEMHSKKHGENYLAVITRGARPGAPLDDKDYTALRPEITEGALTYFSKPGLYGWDQIDAGSEFLAQHLSEFCTNQTPSRILDLGCGYGYLSVQAHRLFAPQRLVATDNNAAAILACRRNFLQHKIQGEVIPDNCAHSITERFDLVICNPPFHQGFATERDLTEAFVAAAHRLCAPHGTAAFVVNAFIPIERCAASHFKHIVCIANNSRFKLIKFSNH